ncbi:MAG: ATP-binding protein [Oscillibacter sp.]|nr:ATP-binding protein [Oscillibacter sp.]
MGLIKQLKCSLSSALSNFFKAENFIEQLVHEFQLPQYLTGRITLCVIEAVNNSVLHGNKLNPDKMVKIIAEQYTDRICIIVEDEGNGFDYTHIPNPTASENMLKVYGRGLYLISSLTNELAFQEGGRKVIMSFFHKNEDTV